MRPLRTPRFYCYSSCATPRYRYKGDEFCAKNAEHYQEEEQNSGPYNPDPLTLARHNYLLAPDDNAFLGEGATRFGKKVCHFVEVHISAHEGPKSVPPCMILGQIVNSGVSMIPSWTYPSGPSQKSSRFGPSKRTGPRLTEQVGGPVRSYAVLMSLFRSADER